AIPLEFVHPALALGRLGPEPGELRLEAPVRRRRLARAGQRRRVARPVLAAPLRGGGRRQALLARLALAGASAIRPGRLGDVRQQVVRLQRSGPVVVVLEQQPLGLARGLSRPHQVPATPKLVAEELEAQVSLGELLARIPLGGPDAVVEARDMAAAILALRNLAFEPGVAQGVVLDFDRHSLDAGVVARTLGHGPALQCIADLEPEVVVAPAGVMELDDEYRAAPPRGSAGLGLPRPGEVPFAAVIRPRHRVARLRTRACAALPSSRTSRISRIRSPSWTSRSMPWNATTPSSPRPSPEYACGCRGSAAATT